MEAGLGVAHAELLAQSELFSGLDRLGLARLAGYLDPIQVRAGDVLFHQGDTGDALYLISAGTFAAVAKGEGLLGEVRLNTLGTGECVGELALLTSEPRSATVRADTDGEVLRLDRDRFMALARTDATTALALLSIVTRRLRAADAARLGGPASPAAPPLVKNPAPDGVRDLRPKRRTRFRSAGVAVIAAAGLTGVAVASAMGGDALQAFLLLLAAAIALWIVQLVPDAIVGLGLVVAWILLRIASPQQALAGFASSEWIFVVSILGLANAVARSGLLYRAGLVLVRRLPAKLFLQAGALLLTGVLLTPLLPMNQGRAALTSPLALAIADASRLRDRSPAAAVLGMAAWIGAGPLMFLFLNGSPPSLLAWGLLPQASRELFDWTHWLLAALPFGVFMALAALLLLFGVFRPTSGSSPSRERLALQLAVLGPVARQEIAVTGILLLTLVGWLLAPTLHLDLGTVALTGLLAVAIIGSFGSSAFRELDWGFLVFYGVAIGLSGIAGRLGVDQLAAQVVSAGLGRVGSGWLVFVVGVAVLATLIQLILPKNAAVLLLGLAVIPIAPAAGVHPWIAVLILVATSSFWLLPTQTSSYLVAYSSSEGRLFSHQQARTVAFGYAALTLLGLLVCVPYWHVLGLM